MYIVLRGRVSLTHHKFASEYDAKVWCLHNGFAFFVVVNKIGDKVIRLKDGVKIEKIR